MLLRCYLVHISIIILKQNLYLVYFCPYVSLGLFMSYLYGLFFIFSLIFIFINYMTSIKQTQLVFAHFLEHLLIFLTNNVDEKSEQYSKSPRSVSGCCLAFAYVFANFSLTLLIKALLIKKHNSNRQKRFVVTLERKKSFPKT